MVQIIVISTSIINNRGQLQQPRDQLKRHRPQLTSYAPGDLHRAAMVSTYPTLRSVANERSPPEPVVQSANRSHFIFQRYLVAAYHISSSSRLILLELIIKCPNSSSTLHPINQRIRILLSFSDAPAFALKNFFIGEMTTMFKPVEDMGFEVDTPMV